MSRLGIIDNVLQVVIGINSIFLVMFGVPIALVLHDLTRTLRRFHVLTNHWMMPDLDSARGISERGGGSFRKDDKWRCSSSDTRTLRF